MTIEERANKTYPINKEDWDDTIEWTTMADILEDKREAYIRGATDQDPISRAEQKKIDIEKAWQIIVTEFYKNKRLDKDIFIKAMEE